MEPCGFCMRGFTISSGNPMWLLLLISTDTVAKGQGWGLVTGRSTPEPLLSPLHTPPPKLPLSSRKTQFSI